MATTSAGTMGPAAATASSTITALVPHAITPTAATVALRGRVAHFLRGSRNVWAKVPEPQTRLLATPAVLEEVIVAASAFHANKQGMVDVVWVKKDMPREALKYEEVGYWRRQAGPGPSSEQLEVQLMRDIPDSIMDAIRDNNDLELIAQYIYPFIDFWALILRHLLTWLACILFYAYLMILQPTLIVGESSKLLNVFLRLPPSVVFKETCGAATVVRLITGNFTLAWLKSICACTSYEYWEELELISDDYIPALGIPLIVQYGILPHQFAIYIPKYHPYGPFHVISLRRQMLTLDRRVRNIIELAIKIIKSIPSIPLDESRRACLLKIRAFIMKEAARLGLLVALDKAKAELKLAGMAFIGQQRRLAGPSSGSARQNPSANRKPDDPKAVGEPKSPERLAWVVVVINKLREEMEAGKLSGLLACPRDFVHGSIEHALWLLRTPGKDFSIVNSAAMTNANSPRTQLEADAMKKAHDNCGEATARHDTNRLSLHEAMALLAVPMHARDPNNARYYHAFCPYCSADWVVKGKAHHAHTCAPIRELFAPSLQAALMETEAGDAILAEKDMSSKEQTYSVAGVTRWSGTVPLSWVCGKRISQDDEVLKAVKDEPTEIWRDRARPNADAPVWERAMDTRGRLLAPCLQATRIYYVYQLLAIESFAAELLEDGQLKPVKGLQFTRLSDHLETQPQIKQTKKQKAVLAKEEDHHWIAIATVAEEGEEEEPAKEVKKKGGRPKKQVTGEQKPKRKKKEKTPDEWATEQALAMLNEKYSNTSDAECGLSTIEQVIQQRLATGCLRPYWYDYVSKRDIFLESLREDAEEEDEKEA